MSRIFDISDREAIQAKSFVDELLHSAPQTSAFFNKDIDIGDIISRHEQKENAKENNINDAVERCKTFEKSNAQDITNIRNQLNVYAQFALLKGCNSMNQALSPRIVKQYIDFRENQCKNGEITIGTMKAICSNIRMLGYFATSTPKYKNVDYTKLTTRAYNNAKEYIKEHKTEKKSSEKGAYTKEEFQRIIDNFTNEKFKVAANLSFWQGLRLENVATVYVDTKWQKNDGKWVRVPNAGTIALISKGTQRHTLKVFPDILDNLRKYKDENCVFRCNKRSLEKHLKTVCDKLGIKKTRWHNLRYSFANRTFRELLKSGVDIESAKRITSESMYHRRSEITKHYLR